METLTLEEFNSLVDQITASAKAPAAESVDPSEICNVIKQHGGDIQEIVGVLKAAAIFFPAAGKAAELIQTVWTLAGNLC